MNSLGKDAVLCLEWLTTFAKPSKIVSMNMEFLAPHPDDEKYFKYLKKRYPTVKFIKEMNPFEITSVCQGVYQDPITILKDINNFDYDFFDVEKFIDDIRIENKCDYICEGKSRYESFDRASFFHRYGLLKDNKIYPLGFMSKKQVLSLINFKVHPVYKLSKSSLDTVSYFKMRANFIKYPEFYKKLIEFYPMFVLDKYRWENLFK